MTDRIVQGNFGGSKDAEPQKKVKTQKQHPPGSKVFQFRIVLQDVKPEIWRRFQVLGTVKLDEFCAILCAVMGWSNSHLRMLFIDDKGYAPPEDEGMGLPPLDETKYTLQKVVTSSQNRLQFDYDFGDSWQHELVLEKIEAPQDGQIYPRCLEGQNACPPEDVGGVEGYADFLKAIRNPKHREHKNMLEWVGGKFDPKKFDLEAINQALLDPPMQDDFFG